ncbi:glycosyltransferase [Winogradskyella forsetii]|uniref:glycosyltransferase n=1 Tax=Winogradskyella forsetii TaxID=2686077 RepID=UPI0015CD85B1|nr:glycosyltransferase [Winogradskyella forsetii]
MTIIHILEDYSILSGGIRTVVRNLHLKLLSQNHDSIIVTPFFEDEDESLIKIPIRNKQPWVYSKYLRNILTELNLKSGIDVIHIHGVWMFPQYYGCKFALKNKIPFVISFHGMYEPWLWKSGYFKKMIYTKFLTQRIFNQATAIHSITKSETIDLNARFKNVRVVEIPNLISLKKADTQHESEQSSDYILFLGRLDPIKGINLLIEAFKLIKDNNIKLRIAGPTNDYQDVLKSQVEELSLVDRVEFLGLVSGAEKQKLYKNALVFVSPSFSEVIGMVNLEAAIHRTVVITTHQTGLDKEWSNNGGFLINPKVNEIRDAIETVLSWDDDTRELKENQLQEFVSRNYSWENRYQDWENLYKSIRKNNG